MATLIVGKSLKDTDVLWRYLSLDKLIDLVESKTLFFTPLAWYSKTDPFEGYMPQVGMEAMASISRKYRDQSINELQKLAQMLPEQATPQMQKLRENAESHLPTMKVAGTRALMNPRGCGDCTPRVELQSELALGRSSPRFLIASRTP
jgi:hypothetical protein